MFTCPKCSNETRTLKAGIDGLGCPDCYKASNRSSVNLHIKAGLTGTAKNVTMATKDHIWKRTVSPDGKSVINKSTGKRWSW